MKSTMLVVLFSTTLLFSCGNETPRTISSDKESTSESKTTSSAEPVTKAVLEGDYYSGMFEASGDIKYEKDPTFSNKISIQIQQLANGLVKGKSIVAGNERPFEGQYTQQGNVLTMQAKEPGNDPYDGQFEATFDTAAHTMKGKWMAFDKKLAAPTREYNLKLTHFSYKPELALPENVAGAEIYDKKLQQQDNGQYEAITADALKYNPSTTALKKSDIENLFKGDLEIIRNSIYARHGYSFKNRRMRYIFDQLVEWYIPVSTDVREQLTALEKENIELLKRYEQHADKYYDEFSR
jgi:hypothetical protein